MGKGRPVSIGFVEVEGRLDLENVNSEQASSRPLRPDFLLSVVTLSGFDLCPDSEVFDSFFLLLTSGLFDGLSFFSSLGFLCPSLLDFFSGLSFLLK